AGPVYLGRVLYQCKGELAENSSLEVREGTRFICANAFEGCSNLQDIMIPSSVDSIGEDTFKGCTSLETAPDLPATTLAGWCYDEMFNGCTSLNSIKCLATSGINVVNSTAIWVKGVASSGIFTADPSATSWPTGDNGIPTGWTRKNPDGSDWVDPEP
ncbi:MAG: leucine-rich repeat protein, partial [Bacteroidales bacterium]|nr:leucine-rich repeat protein [Bacteroidales bacterium]